jgi:hypothetical protein
MGTSLLRQSTGCLAPDVMSKGLGAILLTGDSLSAKRLLWRVLGFEEVVRAPCPHLQFCFKKEPTIVSTRRRYCQLGGSNPVHTAAVALPPGSCITRRSHSHCRRNCHREQQHPSGMQPERRLATPLADLPGAGFRTHEARLAIFLRQAGESRSELSMSAPHAAPRPVRGFLASSRTPTYHSQVLY